MALKYTIGSARRGGRMMARALAMCLMAACTAGVPEASEVTLRVKGGGLEVKGELKSFDGLKYVVEKP